MDEYERPWAGTSGLMWPDCLATAVLGGVLRLPVRLATAVLDAVLRLQVGDKFGSGPCARGGWSGRGYFV